MEGLEVEGTPFSVLMQQAVKLKTHVHKIDRVKFDKWPKFYQNSVYVKDEQKAERQLSFQKRLKVAKDYKNAGDAWLKGGVDPLQASLNYEWAIGLFKWATTLDPDWRKKSVDDTMLREGQFDGDTPSERLTIRDFKVVCYLNLSRSYFKQADFATARQACDWALALEPNSDRALLLRAKCLVEPPSHGASERDSAIVDLEQAMEALEVETALASSSLQLSDAAADSALRDLARRRKEAAALLAQLRRLRAAGRAADKQFAGLFDRGELYDPEETACRAAEAKRAAAEAGEPRTGLSPRAELAAAERLVGEYEEQGRVAEAEELRAGLKAAKAKLAAGKAWPPPPDFRNPTADMVADAKSRGIDLDDPAVQDMLNELQNGHSGRNPDEVDAEEFTRDAADQLSVRELMKELAKLGVAHDHCETKTELRDLYAAALQDTDRAQAKACAAAARPRPAPQPAQTWRYTLAIAALLVVYRLWSMRLLE
ncbi:hypothetical protein M885DRAFT_123238 [Pelagophyceae sp. CCMP2097]|nr:hypothetical protein M885DRAFT_123238 [Pelagophyceae sp. CCMP2097]